MPLILGANSVSGGYEVDNSLRFENTSTDGLTRTITTSGNRQIWTWSGWVKRSKLTNTTGDPQILFNAGENTFGILDILIIRFNTDDKFFVIGLSNGGVTTDFSLTTNAVYRDVSAWYHVVVAFDSTQATASNRVKIYINGVQETSLSATYPALNYNSFVNFVTRPYYGIGDRINVSGQLFAGYMAEVYLIDGQQLTPSSFGETDEDTNIWKPIPYTGSFGTNGFYLKFANSAALGTDSSGNGNNFTVNNLTSVDQSTDTCTNNFATLNLIAAQAGSGVSSAVNTFTEGNLKVADLASDTAIANFGVSTGKWFWEVQVVTDQDGIAIGACNDGFNLNAELGYNSPTSQANGKVFGYYGSGSKFTTIGDGTQFSAYGSAIAVNDIIGVALNLDTNEVTFYKNGSSQGTFSITALGSGESYFPAIGNWSVGAVVANYNFGSPPFTISSGNADANGYGNFEYAVPSGYFALCTKNLAEYA